MKSVEQEYKLTKIKAVVKMYQNPDPTMKLVLDFEERSASQGNQSLILEAYKMAGELGIEIKSASHPRHRWTRTSSRQVQRPTREVYERAIM